MIVWLLLLVLIVFFMYMWQARLGGGSSLPSKCNTCPGKKNVVPVE